MKQKNKSACSVVNSFNIHASGEDYLETILFRHIKMIKLCILKDSYEQILKDYTKSFLLTNIRIRTTI